MIVKREGVSGTMKQSIAFSQGESDAWFERNRTKLGAAPDEVQQTIEYLQIRSQRILEIGCSNGYRLEKLRTCFNAHKSLAARDSRWEAVISQSFAQHRDCRRVGIR
jgi:hypothetical protein